MKLQNQTARLKWKYFQRLCNSSLRLAIDKIFSKNLFYLLIVALIFYWLSGFYLKFLNKISSRDFVTILYWVQWPIIILFCLLGIIIFFPKMGEKIKKNGDYINVILVIATLLVTFSIYFIYEFNVFYNTNTALVDNNILNAYIAQSMILSQSKFQGFDNGFYKTNISFITKNFITQDCVDHYFDLIVEMDTFNQVTKNEENAKIISLSQKILDDLRYVSNNCHNKRKLW